jgi:hypothetical protein
MDRDKLIFTLQQIKSLAEKCLADLGSRTKSKEVGKKLHPMPTRSHDVRSIDYDMPVRPFIKRYAKGMSGPEKFVLLSSRLTKGDPNKDISLEELQRRWNSMTSKALLNQDFNYFFPAQAKDNDWVETKKKGSYNLRPSWTEIFNG